MASCSPTSFVPAIYLGIKSNANEEQLFLVKKTELGAENDQESTTSSYSELELYSKVVYKNNAS